VCEFLVFRLAASVRGLPGSRQDQRRWASFGSKDAETLTQAPGVPNVAVNTHTRSMRLPAAGDVGKVRIILCY